MFYYVCLDCWSYIIICLSPLKKKLSLLCLILNSMCSTVLSNEEFNQTMVTTVSFSQAAGCSYTWSWTTGSISRVLMVWHHWVEVVLGWNLWPGLGVPLMESIAMCLAKVSVQVGGQGWSLPNGGCSDC